MANTSKYNHIFFPKIVSQSCSRENFLYGNILCNQQSELSNNGKENNLLLLFFCGAMKRVLLLCNAKRDGDAGRTRCTGIPCGLVEMQYCVLGV